MYSKLGFALCHISGLSASSSESISQIKGKYLNSLLSPFNTPSHTSNNSSNGPPLTYPFVVIIKILGCFIFPRPLWNTFICSSVS